MNNQIILRNVTMELQRNKIQDLLGLIEELNTCEAFGVIIPSRLLPQIKREWNLTYNNEALVADAYERNDIVQMGIYKHSNSVMIHSK